MIDGGISISGREQAVCVCGWAISGVHDARLGRTHISRAAANATAAYSILEHLKNVIRRGIHQPHSHSTLSAFGERVLCKNEAQ